MDEHDLAIAVLNGFIDFTTSFNVFYSNTDIHESPGSLVNLIEFESSKQDLNEIPCQEGQGSSQG